MCGKRSAARTSGPLVARGLRSADTSDWIICFRSGEVEYSDLSHNRGVIAWLDDDAARFAASKETAQPTTRVATARVLQRLEIICLSVIWVQRDCSFSGPLDSPSRS